MTFLQNNKKSLLSVFTNQVLSSKLFLPGTWAIKPFTLAPISAQNRMPRDSSGSFASAVAQMWTATRAWHGNDNREVWKVGALLASITVVSLKSKSRSTEVNVRKCSNSHLFWTLRNKLSQGIKLLPPDWYSTVNSQSWKKPQVQRWSWSYSDFSLLSIKYSKSTSPFLLAPSSLKNQFTVVGCARLTLSKYNPLNSKSYMDLKQLLAGPTGAPQLHTEKEKSSELPWPSTQGSTTVMMSWQVYSEFGERKHFTRALKELPE